MAITKNAKKAIRSHARKRVYNIRRKRALHDAIHTIETRRQKGDTITPTHLATAYQAIDKAAKRGVISKNTAARKKSRLTRRVIV
ncbi:MAG TPA: 30S ribosomal protein S20 [Candidatus Paceibacterota bacterium]|nr:30S ribosomal protein S20 [Candidatus Paceibacterota bacterium]